MESNNLEKVVLLGQIYPHSNLLNITCVREIIWKQNWGPKHSTEIKQIFKNNTYTRWSYYSNWFRLSLFVFSKKSTSSCFLKNGSLLDMQHGIVRLLEVSTREAQATLKWLSYVWKVCTLPEAHPWTQKCQQFLDWSKGVFQGRAVLQLKWERDLITCHWKLLK